MKHEFLSADRWREAAKSDKQPGALRKEFAVEVKANELEDSRQLTFTISTDSVDRQKDTIAVEGWRFDAYLKNPVVLWGHDYSMLPVGRSVKIWSDQKGLRSTYEPTPAGMVRFNDIVYDLYKGGFLNAVSVGFNPFEFDWSEDKDREWGIDFKVQELLEYSAVTVPANPDALIEARSAGIDINPVLEHAVDTIRRCVNASTVREFEKALRDVGFSHAEAKATAPIWFPQREVEASAAHDNRKEYELIYGAAGYFLARAHE